MRKRCENAGYTLIELIIAIAAAGLLMAGLSSAILIAAKAADSNGTPTADAIVGQETMNDLIADLEFAQSFTETEPTAITFTVPDRNGDKSPETIRYAWGGSKGSPLTRQYNGGVASTVAENVYAFRHNLPAARQIASVEVQVGADNRALIRAAVRLLNSPF